MKRVFLLVFKTSTDREETVFKYLDQETAILDWHSPFDNAVFLVSALDSNGLRDRIHRGTGLGWFVVAELNVGHLGKNVSGWLPVISWQFLLQAASTESDPTGVAVSRRSLVGSDIVKNQISQRKPLQMPTVELVDIADAKFDSASQVVVTLSRGLEKLGQVFHAKVNELDVLQKSGRHSKEQLIEIVDQVGAAMSEYADIIEFNVPLLGSEMENAFSYVTQAIQSRPVLSDRDAAKLKLVVETTITLQKTLDSTRGHIGNFWRNIINFPTVSKGMERARVRLLTGLAKLDGEIAAASRLARETAELSAAVGVLGGSERNASQDE